MHDLYVLKSADEFMDWFLQEKGYAFIDKSKSERMIVYQLTKENYFFTLFVFAFGKKKTESFDNQLYYELLSHPFLYKGSIPLIAYLQIEEREVYGYKKYFVHDYSGERDFDGEFWRISKIGSNLELVTYFREGWLNLTQDFTYAYNHMDYDIFSKILTDDACIEESSGEKYSGKKAIYSYLRMKKKECAKATIGYMRRNDIIYFSAPYIENHYYIGFYTNQNNIIDRIRFYKIQTGDELILNGVYQFPEDYSDLILGGEKYE